MSDFTIVLSHHELHLIVEALVMAESGDEMNLREMLAAQVNFHALRSLTSDSESRALLDKFLDAHAQSRSDTQDGAYQKELMERAKARNIELSLEDPPTERGSTISDVLERLIHEGFNDPESN